jgi:hypothetical protein
MSRNFNVPQLVAAGCGVGDLRKLGVSPADIRSAGFTIQEMNVFLGIDRLCEAGFTLTDFRMQGFHLKS